jgi:DNA-directed RNA polymerase subunit delta
VNLNMTMNTITTTHVNEEGVLVFAGSEMQSFERAGAVFADVSEVEESAAYGYGLLTVQAARKKKEEDEEEEDDADVPADEEAGDDDWEDGEEGAEEEDEWDPDFDEFDIPKSTKKGGGGKEDEEEDIKFDEDLNEFDDLFGDAGDDFDDDDDF